MANDDIVDEDVTHDPELHAVSYTSIFRIRRRMRKLNDFTIPSRNGIGPEQFGAAFVVFLICVITWFLVLSPLLHILSSDVPWMMPAAWLLFPPFLAAQRIGKPMPDGKTISGWMRGRVRRYLDDEWHRRGVPVKRRSHEGKEFHFLRVWEPDTEGSEYIADLTGIPDLYRRKPVTHSPSEQLAARNYIPVDLADWVNNVEHIDAEKLVAERAEQARKKADAANTVDRVMFGQVHTPDHDHDD